MRRWLVRRLVQRGYDALGAGEAAPVVRLFRPDARLRFAGTHSWAVDTDDRHQIASWFERFAALRPGLVVLDVVVNGPPWNMSACVVFDDAFRDPSGRVVYANHGVQYVRLRWGKIFYDEVNLDTQRVAEYDALMGLSGPD
jgi:ketosteroid isomerase-like protein